jgi:hypothetical protein
MERKDLLLENAKIFTASRLRREAQVARHSRLITQLLVDE